MGGTGVPPRNKGSGGIQEEAGLGSLSVSKPRLGRPVILPPLRPQCLSSSSSPLLSAHPKELGLHRRGGLCGAAMSLTVLVCPSSVLGQWQAQAGEDEHHLSLLLAFSPVVPMIFWCV